MIELLLKSNTKTIRTENIEVVYNLIFKNALYSIECYKEGTDRSNPNNYCLIEDITDDEGEAESFLQLMARGKVFPVHINDMAIDYFKE
jgi:adenine C2-methylase RlmN of 23S rRNA A2503 and tRNA A37